jgi:hypothetical protein
MFTFLVDCQTETMIHSFQIETQNQQRREDDDDEGTETEHQQDQEVNEGALH